MIKRCEKLAFMEVTEGSSTVYKRMTGFTELSVSKNPKEYTRKYVDEFSERNAVVGYSPSISYKMDYELPPHLSLYNIEMDEPDIEEFDNNGRVLRKLKKVLLWLNL